MDRTTCNPQKIFPAMAGLAGLYLSAFAVNGSWRGAALGALAGGASLGLCSSAIPNHKLKPLSVAAIGEAVTCLMLLRARTLSWSSLPLWLGLPAVAASGTALVTWGHTAHTRRSIAKMSDAEMIELAKTADLTPSLASNPVKQLAALAVYASHQPKPFHLFEDRRLGDLLLNFERRPGKDAFALASKHCPEQTKLLREILISPWSENFIYCGPKMREQLLLEKKFKDDQLEAMKYLFTPDEWRHAPIERLRRADGADNVHRSLATGDLRTQLTHRNTLKLVRSNPRYLDIYEQACAQRPGEDFTNELIPLRAAAWGIAVPEWVGEEKDFTLVINRVKYRVNKAAVIATCSTIRDLQSDLGDGDRLPLPKASDPHEVMEVIEALTTLRRPSLSWLSQRVDTIVYLGGKRLLERMHRELRATPGNNYHFEEARKAPIDEMPDDLKEHWNSVRITNRNWDIALAYARYTDQFPDLADEVVDHVLEDKTTNYVLRNGRRQDNLEHDLTLLWKVEAARDGCKRWAARNPRWVLSRNMDQKKMPAELVGHAIDKNQNWIQDRGTWVQLWIAAKQDRTARAALVAIASNNQKWVSESWSDPTRVPADLVHLY